MTTERARPPLTYAASGVDDEAARRFVERIAPIARSTHRPEVLAGVGPFAALFKLTGAYREPVLVASTDGVGTKVKIAALLRRYDTIGVDLVNQTVNDLLTVGAEPLFFLDYLASSTLTEDEKTALIQGVAAACREAGCALIGGETATLPDVYAPGDFDFAGFAVGVIERDAIIDGSRIAAGDALFALPSSGLHTNGYSLARRALGVGVGGDAAEERARLECEHEELGATLGEALLAHHRSYLRELRPLLSRLKGIAHITGGGALPGNVARMLPEGLGARLERSAWQVPPLFRLVQREGGISDDEMWRAFNMGLGIVFAVDPSDAAAVRSALPEALLVGEVIAAEGDERVRIE
jgi:phosphoribosylformylglycinamidine cyclo-ligase